MDICSSVIYWDGTLWGITVIENENIDLLSGEYLS